MRTVRLVAAKRGIAVEFPPGHPGREAILALPDEISAGQFDAVFPLLVRLLKTPTSGGRPGAVERPGAGSAGSDGKTRL